jgi:hypothetical protein
VKNNRHCIEPLESGEYRISLARWPRECQVPIHSIPEKNPKQLYTYRAIFPEYARLNILGKNLEKKITPTDQEIHFEVNLPKEKILFDADFVEAGETFGAYYIYIQKL